ncbi:hypothetical protein FGL86_03815 [Pistricoccus aurantiacus]|uniref:Uncharacterized protein n=1 Tax=Pistricoccus aurantiacus TaxID=1883414 RepID=A0A5B8SS49_9GAMM|nr:hypothetical protein [Pistricoccus aurantiacus]QEA38285.1 hypothetical protein FGL86_03815 [Pistricoccus aurantiacus]
MAQSIIRGLTPSKAIWASVNGELYQGKLDIRSLRAISGQIRSKLVVFVEDDFAEMWVNSILISIESIARDAVSIHPMKGDGTAVKVHKNHNLDPSAKQKSVCIIDGDSEQKENQAEFIFRLPGQCPESAVYDNILENIDKISGELAVALLKPYEFESQLIDRMKSVRNTNRDPHLLYAQLGKKIGFVPEARVKEAFLTIWCRLNTAYVESISTDLAGLVPLETDEVSISYI